VKSYHPDRTLQIKSGVSFLRLAYLLPKNFQGESGWVKNHI
jgi:hypothetical protein